MSTFTRLLAIGAIAAVPGAVAVSTAVAQAPSQYQPYTPAPTPAIITETFAENIVDAIEKLSAKKLLDGKKTVSFTFAIEGAGTYDVKITARIPGKKTRTLSRGKLVVPAGSTAKTAKVGLKRTSDGKALNKAANKKKFKGKTIPVKVVVTYTSPTGVKTTVTEKGTIKK